MPPGSKSSVVFSIGMRALPDDNPSTMLSAYSVISAYRYWNSLLAMIFRNMKCGINLTRYYSVVKFRPAPVARDP